MMILLLKNDGLSQARKVVIMTDTGHFLSSGSNG